MGHLYVMAAGAAVNGREFSAELLERLNAEVRTHPDLSRSALSRRVCDWLDWKGPDGEPKQVSCRISFRLNAGQVDYTESFTIFRVDSLEPPRLRVGSEATWARNDDAVFFWDRSGTSESDPLEFFRYELGNDQPDLLSVIVPDDCDDPRDFDISPGVPAAFDRDTVAMTFFCL